MVWLGNDADTDSSIAKAFPQIVVVFVKLSSVAGATSTAPTILTLVPQENHHSLSVLDLAYSASDGHSTPPSPLCQASEMEVDPSLAWLAPAHAGVDTILKCFPAIDKIKTIGELVMIAGPFNDKYSVGEAADQALAAVSQIREVSGVACGMHVGEIVGAVLGTNRLCFDIFGDTVNTSSRALSTGGPNDISVTTEFYDFYRNYHDCGHEVSLPESPLAEVAFGHPLLREAKGKEGGIEVRSVRSLVLTAKGEELLADTHEEDISTPRPSVAMPEPETRPLTEGTRIIL